MCSLGFVGRESLTHTQCLTEESVYGRKDNEVLNSL